MNTTSTRAFPAATKKVDMNRANLQVSLTGPGTAYPGRTVSYTLEVTNIGAAVAHDVDAVVQTGGLTQVNAHPGWASLGSLLVSTTTLTGLRWGLGVLGPAMRAVVTLTGSVAADSGPITVVAGACTSTPETRLLNNIASVHTLTAGPGPRPGPDIAGVRQSSGS